MTENKIVPFPLTEEIHPRGINPRRIDCDMPADNLSEPPSADVEITERRHNGAGEVDTLASGDHAGVDENSNKDTYECKLSLC